MSDKPYFELNPKAQLTTWVAGQMLKGAGWGALVFLALIAIALVLLGIAALLPVNPYALLQVAPALAAFA